MCDHICFRAKNSQYGSKINIYDSLEFALVQNLFETCKENCSLAL